MASEVWLPIDHSGVEVILALRSPRTRETAKRWRPAMDVVMRFKVDGPAIPDILLDQRDAGNVVFLVRCGGVGAMPGCPDFLQPGGTRDQARSICLRILKSRWF